jgi:hypothetical protein
VWREMNFQIIKSNWRMSKILPADWSADIAMDGEQEKSRINEATNDLESFIPSF